MTMTLNHTPSPAFGKYRNIKRRKRRIQQVAPYPVTGSSAWLLPSRWVEHEEEQAAVLVKGFFPWRDSSASVPAADQERMETKDTGSDHEEPMEVEPGLDQKFSVVSKRLWLNVGVSVSCCEDEQMRDYVAATPGGDAAILAIRNLINVLCSSAGGHTNLEILMSIGYTSIAAQVEEECCKSIKQQRRRKEALQNISRTVKKMHFKWSIMRNYSTPMKQSRPTRKNKSRTEQKNGEISHCMVNICTIKVENETSPRPGNGLRMAT
ncbi:uncharacterized protein LOC128341520 [Hemicordylus capensis]|uniref:uncharacterized protein LOC128341520 n=1 Tax=Hemicordylus capensis TaxID=884348 RepID=UPI0023041DCF|nr:uncharacterized protein LOC128341520 [Hemicordylus capensis]